MNWIASNISALTPSFFSASLLFHLSQMDSTHQDTSSSLSRVAPVTSEVRELHGRYINRHKEYMLPADRIEHARLDLQHQVLRLHLKSLYDEPRLVKQALTRDAQRRATVLDVGTGSGSWAVDMAQEFPHADVIGIDLVLPTMAKNGQTLPTNCRLQIGDANAPLSEWEAGVDVLHARSVEAGIRDFDLFLYQSARCLRPGGVLLLGSGSPQIYHEDHTPFCVTEEGQPGFTWIQWVFAAVYDAFRKRGNYNVDSMLYWHEWLERNPNFENVVTKDTYIPLGVFREGLDPDQTKMAEMMRENTVNILDSFRPLLLTVGHDPEAIDRAVKSCAAELQEQKVHSYMRYRSTTAVRRDALWQPRVGLAPPINSYLRLVAPLFSE